MQNKISFTCLRDIVYTRICHADADTDADTNGIRTEANISPLHLWPDIMILDQMQRRMFTQVSVGRRSAVGREPDL